MSRYYVASSSAPLTIKAALQPASRRHKADRQTLSKQRVRHELHQVLLLLPAPAFEHLIACLLSDLGYFEVKVLRGGAGNHRTSRKGRTTHGGMDLRAFSQTDLSTALTAVQVKQYRRPVSRHFVDGLRGAMLRTQAREGLLITTSTFSPVAKKAAAADHIAPIRLLDGKELLDLLFLHQLGVRRTYMGRWSIDQRFLGELQPPHRPRGSDSSHLPQRTFRSSAPDEPYQPNCHSSHESPTSLANLILIYLLQHDQPKPHRPEGGGMMWHTHVMAGLNSLWLLSLLPQGITAENIAVVTAAAAFGSLLPDLDAADSKIKHLRIAGIKPFAPIAIALYEGLGHRGLLHSLLGLGLLTLYCLPLVFWSWWGWQASAALVLGYASHLAADACTKSGIPVCYPSRRRYHLLPRVLRVTTGSPAEELVFVGLAMLLLPLLLRYFPFIGV